jgi:cytochrome oxidase Cu insertion factor (SCO1/SenC/PrrC family)
MTAAVRSVQIITLVVCLVWLLAMPATAQTGQEPAVQPMIGDEAPPFTLESVQGNTLSLEELRGQFVVVHFGASW